MLSFSHYMYRAQAFHYTDTVTFTVLQTSLLRDIRLMIEWAFFEKSEQVTQYRLQRA